MTTPQKTIAVATFSELRDATPVAAKVADVDLVLVRLGDAVHVLSGLCPHRRAHLAEGTVEGCNLVCPSHAWDFNITTGKSEQIPGQDLAHFGVWIDAKNDAVLVDEAEISAWRDANRGPFKRDEYYGA